MDTNDANDANATERLRLNAVDEVSRRRQTELEAMRAELLEAERVGSIVGAFYAVYNYYGYGLSETIYSGALELELRDRGHDVVRELGVAVSYKGRHVAWQRLDMVVDDRVIIENKPRRDEAGHHRCRRPRLRLRQPVITVDGACNAERHLQLLRRRISARPWNSR